MPNAGPQLPPPGNLPAVAQIVHAKRRENLLCVRIGNGSAFQKWFRPDAPRNWDLLLSYYVDPKGGGVPGADIVAIGGLSKFSAIKDIADRNPNLFDGYRALWLLDDDI